MADTKDSISRQYDFTGKTFVVTGGTGVLGRQIVSSLAGCGANIALLTRDPVRGKSIVDSFGATKGPVALYNCDVLDRNSLERAAEDIRKRFPQVDGLINGAGGNSPKATTNKDQSFFNLAEADLKNVSDLNLLGTILPSQIFGKLLADRKEGVILNITSMTADRPLTRIPAYSGAKAAVSNFTRWLAVHMAQEYSPGIRVNAIAPGFFLTEQNRFLLTERETGKLTERGKKIIEHTPMARFGEADEIVGAVLWLLSPASKFVTGVVIPIDGGFSAFSGV